jgi:hypothetical protein
MIFPTLLTQLLPSPRGWGSECLAIVTDCPSHRWSWYEDSKTVLVGGRGPHGKALYSQSNSCLAGLLLLLSATISREMGAWREDRTSAKTLLALVFWHTRSYRCILTRSARRQSVPSCLRLRKTVAFHQATDQFEATIQRRQQQMRKGRKSLPSSSSSIDDSRLVSF